MPLGKRKRFTTGRGKMVYGRSATGSSVSGFQIRRTRRKVTRGTSSLSKQVRSLTKMIETKNAQWKSPVNVNMPHNNVYVVQASTGGDLNPLATGQASSDPMSANSGARIGDRISIKGMAIKGMVECSLQRPKVHFRIMLVKCPRGVVPTKNDLFQGNSDNKLIDTVNTEKFTIIWQRRFNVSASNLTANAVQPITGLVTSGTPAGIGVRLFTGWVPGYKLCRQGHLQYENGSTIPKFFDYKLVFLCYDWYGTSQDINNVGVLNEMYTKMYYKDA